MSSTGTRPSAGYPPAARIRPSGPRSITAMWRSWGSAVSAAPAVAIRAPSGKLRKSTFSPVWHMLITDHRMDGVRRRHRGECRALHFAIMRAVPAVAGTRRRHLSTVLRAATGRKASVANATSKFHIDTCDANSCEHCAARGVTPQRAGVLRGPPPSCYFAGCAGKVSGRVGSRELRAEVEFELAALLHAAGEQVGHPCSAGG